MCHKISVRNIPLVIFHDDSVPSEIRISTQGANMPHCIFLPSDDSAGVPPVFLLHRSTQFTVLKPRSLEGSWAYYRHLISNTPDHVVLRHIPTLVQDISMPTIASAIGVACRCSDFDSLQVSFSLLLRNLQERHSLDRPLPSPAQLQQIDLHKDVDEASLAGSQQQHPSDKHDAVDLLMRSPRDEPIN